MNSAHGKCSVCNKWVSLYKENPMNKDSPLVLSTHNAPLSPGQKKYVACSGSRKPPLGQKEPVAQK